MTAIQIGARFTLVTQRVHVEHGDCWWKVLCEVTAIYPHRFEYRTIEVLDLSHEALRDDAPTGGGVATNPAALRIMRVEWQ